MAALTKDAADLENDFSRLVTEDADFLRLEDPSMLCIGLRLPRLSEIEAKLKPQPESDPDQVGPQSEAKQLQTGVIDSSSQPKAAKAPKPTPENKPSLSLSETEHAALFDKVFSEAALQAFAKKHENIVAQQSLLERKGIIVVRLRRFPGAIDLKELSDASCEYRYLFRTKLLVTIKGAESLARSLREAVQDDIIRKFVTEVPEDIDAQQEDALASPDPGFGIYVSNITCTGYKEEEPGSWILAAPQSDDAETPRFVQEPKPEVLEEGNAETKSKSSPISPFLISVVALPRFQSSQPNGTIDSSNSKSIPPEEALQALKEKRLLKLVPQVIPAKSKVL